MLICLAVLLAHSAGAAKRGFDLARIKLSERGGFVEKPFSLQITADPSADSTIRFTVDGSEPSVGSGQIYTNRLAISNTVVVRAAVFRETKRVSRVASETFLFLDGVIHQGNPANYPAGSNAWNGYPSDYGMSAVVVDDPLYRPRMKDALRALPTLAIALGREELFGKEKGIYIHSQERGDNWERRCSVEMFLPDGSRAFQVDCAVRIQGNSNRIPEKTPKRSFRLFFREQLGPAKLHYRIFPDSPVDAFNTLVLRADFNNSWTHWNPVAQVRGQRIRDAWLKDSLRATDSLSTHTRFAHLYLNGLYWGIYDVTERPDASFAAAYLGGKKEDYDVVNEMQSKDGTLAGFNDLMGMSGLTNAAQYEKAQAKLDVTEFVDYLLVNYYAGNHDWGETKNWYAIGGRNSGSRFRFFCWDGEFILQELEDNLVGSGSGPFRLLSELRANQEFKILMADRIQKHFFANGVLTPGPASQRWMKRAGELDLAIMAESARWGGHRRNPPYTRDKDWIGEQQRLMTNWFPQRTAIVLQQLRAAGLYPSIEAPQISPGKSTNPETISFALAPGTNRTVYFTTNGIDPRLPLKNSPHPAAFSWTNAVPLHGPALIKARAREGETWSALIESKY